VDRDAALRALLTMTVNTRTEPRHPERLAGNESGFSKVLFSVVIPAKAGIQVSAKPLASDWQQAVDSTAGSPWTPASAGATITC